MIKRLRYYSSVGLCFIKLSVLKQLEYPLYYISCFIMIPLMYGTGILLLFFVVKNYQALSGWTFPELAFLYGLGQTSHGLMMVFSVQNWWIENYVLHGDFDRMIVRPLDVFFQFTVKYINIVGIMDVLVGLTIFVYGCHMVGFEFSFGNIVKVLMVIIGAVILRSSLFTIFCSVAFWTKRSNSLFLLLNDFLERTTLYPMSIYPQMLQAGLTFIIPIAFISFYPASEFIGMDSSFSIPLSMALWTPLIGLVFAMIAAKVFKMGLKKYESSGS